MHEIPVPESNFNDPDYVLAQSVAGHWAWQSNEVGNVFDATGTMVSSSLPDLGIVMRELGWFVPRGAMATGVLWGEVPQDPQEGSTQVRAIARKLGL